MTQNTQTTAKRIEAILENTLRLIPLMVGVGDDSAEIGGTRESAQAIAAEIDALTAERDEARATIAANNAKSEAWEAEAEAQLAEARAEVERLTPGHDAWQYRQACEAWDAGEISAIQFADAYEKYDPRGRERRARAAAKGGA